jgi:hypothetical protein
VESARAPATREMVRGPSGRSCSKHNRGDQSLHGRARSLLAIFQSIFPPSWALIEGEQLRLF